LLEIATIKCDAELVFLSACETGRGRIVGGEGVLNTARAFLGAGARSVIGTYWQVADDVAAQFAVAFYERLSAGESAPDALRAVKTGLLDAKEHAHPCYWGPYALWTTGRSRH